MNKQDFKAEFAESYKKAKLRLNNEFKLDTSLSPKKQADSIIEFEAEMMAEELTNFLFDSIATIAIAKAKEILTGSNE